MRKRKMLSAETRRMRHGYLFCLPLIVGLLILFIPNMVQTIIFTLNDVVAGSGGYTLEWVGISNYVKALTENPHFFIYLKESLQSLLTNLPVVVIFSLFIAVIVNQKFKGRMFARVLFFIPVLLSTGVVALVESSPQVTVGNTAGIDIGAVVNIQEVQGLKEILLNLNLSEGFVNFIASAADGIYTIVKISGIQIMILLAGLQEISPDLYEAAKVEGCDSWSLFWKIIFPIISPQLLVSGVYTVVDSYSQVSNTLAPYTHSIAFTQNQYGYATAMNFMYFAIVGLAIGILGLITSRYVHYNNG